MFNFASKVINTLGDLINVEEPPKPTTNQQQPQTQRRASGDSHFFQQPRARFHGPTSLSDHNAFREQTSSLGGPPRSSAPVYRYPTPPSSTSHQQASSSPNYSSSKGSSAYGFSGNRGYGQPPESNFSNQSGNQYRSSRHEDKYQASDVNYNKVNNIVANKYNTDNDDDNDYVVDNVPDMVAENVANVTDVHDVDKDNNSPQETRNGRDSYSMEQNYDSPDRSFPVSNARNDYESYEEHRTNDHDMNQREEDRYLSSYEENVGKKMGSRKSGHQENAQKRNKDEHRDKNSIIHSNSSNLNYQYGDSWNRNQNADTISYDDEQYDSPRLADDSQFSDPVDLNMWRDDYCTSQAWKMEESNSFEIKDDKISPSPPSQDEDAKNSSRSESESSDEISFGEALATGLIPPNITPEMAARLNIECVNHPKAVIESIYGHSPGEVYTIPEEEDEIYSPTGADGVTSLRKQRMASARMEKPHVLKELQNQQKRLAQNHQYDTGKMKTQYESSGMDTKGELNQYNTKDGKFPKQVPLQKYQSMRFQQDQVVGQPQTFQHQTSQGPYESNMSYQPQRSLENKAQQGRQQSQKVSRSDGRQQNYQVDPRFPNQMNQQFCNDQYAFPPQNPPDSRPLQQIQMVGADMQQKQQNFMLQPESQIPSNDPTNRSQSYQTGFPPNTNVNMKGHQGYEDNRIPQSSSYCDNRSSQPIQFSDNRSIVANDGRPGQKGQIMNFQAPNSQQSQPQSNYTPSSYQQQYQEPYQQQQQQQQQQVHQPQQQQLSQQQFQGQQPLQQQTTGYIQGQMTDNRQNQFIYPADHRAGSEFQPQAVQNSFGQPLQANANPIPQTSFSQSNTSNQPHNLQSDKPWSAQQSVNHGQPSSYPPSNFPIQQNPPMHAPRCSDSREAYYRDSQQNYPQDPRRQNFQPQFSEIPPHMPPHEYYPQYPSRTPQELNPRDPRTMQHPRRSLPSEPEMPSYPGPDRRKQLPLRRYFSEERESNFQEDYDRSSRRNSQVYENMYLDDRGSPAKIPDQHSKCETPRHRSSSLDSHHDRVEQYTKSRSCSLERNRDLAIEEYEKENRRKQLFRSQSQGDEYSHEDRHRISSTGRPNLSGRSTTNPAERMRRSDVVHDRHRSSPKETRTLSDTKQQTRRLRATQPSLPQNDNLKRFGNYCPQHRRFVPSVGSSTKSSRRQAPKDPALSLSERKKFEKSLSVEMNPLKAAEHAQQRAGILSTAARKSERGGNMKISFSNPISNMANTKNKMLADALKVDKNVATSNTNLVTTHHVCPLTRESTNVILSNPGLPLQRNQLLDPHILGSQLTVPANTRSNPIPIVTRTRSLDRYSSSDTNLNVSPYSYDSFSRPGSAPGLMYEPVSYQNSNPAALQLSLYEMHALKKEEKFWSDIYSALPADMKHLIANRGALRNKFPVPLSDGQSMERGSPSTSLEHRIMQRGLAAKGRDANNLSLGERIGNRLRMLHEMKEQSRMGFNRRKPGEVLGRRSASDSEYSFSSTTNFPLYWNLQRRPHSDSAIDLLERLETPDPPPRMSGSAYNSSEYLPTHLHPRVIDKSQSYLTSPSTNVPPSPAPTQPMKLRDTALRENRAEAVNHPDNRAGFFSCLQNIESLTRQYQDDDFFRDEDEIYSDSGIPESEYVRYDIHAGSRRKHYGPSIRRRNDHFDNV